MSKNITPTEEYLYDESPEISIGEAPGWTRKLLSVFPALRNKNYQLYFAGQAVSLVGNWMQIVVQGWLVWKLTNSAFLLGLVATIGNLPPLLFSLVGGMIADRFSKQKILLFTQVAAMILAFTLGFLTIFGIVTVFWVALLAFLLGMVSAVDMPTRQSFAVEIVGKKDLASAIALNSGIFNAARVIGPTLAGFLIAIFGIGGAFIVNGITYSGIIIALLLIRVRVEMSDNHPHPLKAIKEGVSYALSHPTIRMLLFFTGGLSVFGWSYTTMMPYIAEKTFHLGPDGLGYLFAATGLGALLATVLVSAYSEKVNPLVFIIGGNFIFILAILGFSLTGSLLVASPFLFLSGFGLLSQFATLNTIIQHAVEDRYRGRIMSLYTLMFLGLFPLGNFEIGFLSEHLGWQSAVRLNILVAFLFGLWIYRNRRKIVYTYQHHTG